MYTRQALRHWCQLTQCWLPPAFLLDGNFPSTLPHLCQGHANAWDLVQLRASGIIWVTRAHWLARRCLFSQSTVPCRLCGHSLSHSMGIVDKAKNPGSSRLLGTGRSVPLSSSTWRMLPGSIGLKWLLFPVKGRHFNPGETPLLKLCCISQW